MYIQNSQPVTRTAIAEFQNALEKRLQHLALLKEVAKPPSAHPPPASMEGGDLPIEEPKAGVR